MRTILPVASLLRVLSLVTLVAIGLLENSEAQENGTFSIVPSFGKGELIGGSKTGQSGSTSPTSASVVPNMTSPATKPSGVFEKSPTKVGTQGIAGIPNGSNQGGSTGSLGASSSGGAAHLPLGMVQQVKELVGKNGIATQSTLKAASNLTAAAAKQPYVNEEK